MRTATRFPLKRIAALDQAIRACKYPNAGSLGRYRHPGSSPGRVVLQVGFE